MAIFKREQSFRGCFDGGSGEGGFEGVESYVEDWCHGERGGDK